MNAPTVTVLDSDSFASFASCDNFADGGFDRHGKMGSYAIVDGRPLCYSCTSAVYDRLRHGPPPSDALRAFYLGPRGNGNTRGFPSSALRAAFVSRGIRLGLLNYAVGYLDADPRRPFGLSWGRADWVARGGAYVSDVPGVR